MQCGHCAAENAAAARFCAKCGAPLGARCFACDTELPAGARFCPHCGQPAEAGVTQPTLACAGKADVAQPVERDNSLLVRPAASNKAPGRPAARTTAEGFDSSLTAAGTTGKGDEGLTASERKQVTVLFADVSGFTAFSEQLDPEEVGDIMNALWAKLDPIITDYGGAINKHMGDGLMALFGAGPTRENEPRQAVRAALAMQAALTEYRSPGTGPQLQMRIGIHTGPVVLGLVGTTHEFTATGDTVNVASRLEQQAPVNGVLISHDTYRQVCGLFDIRALPELRAKGRAEPIEVYLVLRAKPRPLALRMPGVEGVQTRMVGRALEFKRLQEAFETVLEDGEPQFLTIVGEAGIGKSRLLHEFQQWMELRPEVVRFFSGRATEEMAGLPFSLLRDVLSLRFEIQDNDAPAAARAKLEHGLVGFFDAASGTSFPKPPVQDKGSEGAAPKGSESSELQAHFIGQLLGLDFSASPHLRGILQDAEQIRQRAFSYLAWLFTAAGRGMRLPGEAAPNQAALLVLQDIHWGDDGSLDLMAQLARTCRDARLMVICVARPTLFERRPAWGEGLATHTRLDLEALSGRASRALVEDILRKVPDLPPGLRELVAGGAEGNPFFIEETIKMLIDEKVIVPGPEQWRIEPTRLAVTKIPPTLTGVLQARVDGLTATERAVLQRASVVGRTFWDSAIRHLSGSAEGAGAGAGLAPEAIQKALLGLRQKELVFQRETSAFSGTVEYIFKHHLMRKFVYDNVLRKVRRAYHGQTAAWLIAQSRERAMELAGLVAAHFEHAQCRREASEWYGTAGYQAARGYAPASAIDCFQKALALLPPETAAPDELAAKRLE